MIEAAQALQRAVSRFLGVEPVVEFSMDYEASEITTTPRWYVTPLRSDLRLIDRHTVQHETELALGLAVRVDRTRANQEAEKWVALLEELCRRLLTWSDAGWKVVPETEGVSLALEPEQLPRGRFLGGLVLRVWKHDPVESLLEARSA